MFQLWYVVCCQKPIKFSAIVETKLPKYSIHLLFDDGFYLQEHNIPNRLHRQAIYRPQHSMDKACFFPTYVPDLVVDSQYQMQLSVCTLYGSTVYLTFIT